MSFPFSFSELIEQAGDSAERLFESQVRLGVTGLRRAGKTVFTTAIVENLLRAGRMPFLDAISSGRYQAARLRPQPDHGVSRFAFEEHLATLTGAPSAWPEPTRGISQLRLAIRYRPGPALRRTLRSTATLNLDIVDYPGEWLLDLPLLRQSFAEWSAFTIALANRAPRDALSRDWRAWLGTSDPAGPDEEEEARRGAALYTAYLHACRDTSAMLSIIQPGRFIEPGDMKDAPLLTFCPLPGERRGRGTLWALMEARYDAYREEVVRGFFANHFARLNRQIVLIDLLGALGAGPSALSDMKQALELSLEPFRHGSAGWLDWIFGRHIDRVAFAATKSDHIASTQHGTLTRLLDGLVAEACNAIRFDGAEVKTFAIAALKSTDTVTAEHEGRSLRCVRGTPLDRDRPTVLHPGELPDDMDAFAAASAHPFRFLSFRPPPGGGRDERGLPHIRLDQTLQFLIGDYLE